jgi:hypothetical protein
LYGLWRSNFHYASAERNIPDVVAASLEEVWNARTSVPSPSGRHPVVAVLDGGQWRYLGWWRAGDQAADVDRRDDPHIYDNVRYRNARWSGGPPPTPYEQPTITHYISAH